MFSRSCPEPSQRRSRPNVLLVLGREVKGEHCIPFLGQACYRSISGSWPSDERDSDRAYTGVSKARKHMALAAIFSGHAADITPADSGHGKARVERSSGHPNRGRDDG